MLANPLEEGELAAARSAPTTPRNGSGTASACRRCRERRASSGCSPAPATTSAAPFPICWRRSTFDARARRRAAGRARRTAVAPFDDLQQRLNRKTVDAKMTAGLPGRAPRLRHPVRGRRGSARPALRRAAAAAGGLACAGRRRRGSTCRRWCRSTRWEELAALRADRPRRRHRGADAEALGQRLRRRAGRKGPWFKWKREPLPIDAVLMYAQRGHGKRSSLLFGLHLRRLGTEPDGGCN